VELRRGLWAFLEELNRNGTPILLTTHYLEEAERLCRQVAIIDHGEIIANTTMRALLDQLDSEVFVLYLRDPLAVLPPLGGFGARLVDPRTLEVCVGRDQDLNELFALLASRGIVVHSMRNKQNRLEALFTRLVGIGEPAQPARQVAV
jgi:ABC-2 type transport system ATP-binding protein